MKTAEISRSHDSRLQPTISTPRLIGEGSLVIKVSVLTQIPH